MYKENNFYLYTHRIPDTNEVYYVGIGNNIGNFYERAYDMNGRNTYHKRMAKKYGCNVVIEDENLNKADAIMKEILAIKYFDTYKNGCNLTKGGEYIHIDDEYLLDKGYKYFEVWNIETQEKIGEYINQTETANKLGVEQNGIYLNLKNRIKYCGKYIFSYDKLSKKKVYEVYCKHYRKRKFKVYKISDGSFAGEWDNKEKCAKDLNINNTDIGPILKEKNNKVSISGFVFIYSNAENFDKKLKNKLKIARNYKAKRNKKFKVYKANCKQYRKRNQPSMYEKGEYIGTFSNITECAKELGFKNKRHISSCLNGKRKQYKNYIFELIKERDNG